MTVRPRSGQRLSASRGDPADLGLGHAGIMLELEGREPAALVAAQAGEGHHSADIAPPRGQCRGLGGGIEGLGLDADRCWHGIAAPYGS